MENTKLEETGPKLTNEQKKILNEIQELISKFCEDVCWSCCHPDENQCPFKHCICDCPLERLNNSIDYVWEQYGEVEE